MEELDKMNSYISIHNGVDAEVKLQGGATSEALILKVTDSNKNYMELTIFSEDEKFPTNILKVFGVKRD